MSQNIKFILFFLVMNGLLPLVYAADPQESQENGWSDLFATLLPYERINVHSEGDNIVVDTADTKMVKHQLNRVFSSNVEFFKQLNYEVKNIKKWSDDNTKNSAITMPETIEEAVAYIKGVFGPDMFKKIKVSEADLFDSKEGAQLKDGILYTSRFEDRKICNKYVCHWMSRINDLSIGQIRSSVRDKNEPARSAQILNSKDIASVCGPFQACCAVLEFNQSYQIIFDVKKVHQLITPPVVEDGKNSSLIINKAHLMTYLKQLTGDGMLLRVIKVGGEKYAEPIMIPSNTRSQKPSQHYVLIDRSGSMQDHYTELTDHLKEFVAKIADSNPKSKIHLIFFADKPIRKDLSLCDTQGITCSIMESSRQVGGNTALITTIYDAISEINRAQLTNSYNVTLTIFTDGVDNGSDKTQDDLNHVVGSMAQESRPKIFALGFGRADEDFLRQLSNTLVGPYIKLKNIEDFRSIEHHVASFKHESQVLQFLVKLVKEHSLTIRVPVIQNDTPQPLGIILPVTQNRINLELHGKPVDIKIGDVNSMKSASIADRIKILRSRSIAIVAQEGQPAKKIRELGMILQELSEIKVFGVEQTRIQQDAITKIKEDIKLMNAGKNSSSSGSYNFFDI